MQPLGPAQVYFLSAALPRRNNRIRYLRMWPSGHRTRASQFFRKVLEGPGQACPVRFGLRRRYRRLHIRIRVWGWFTESYGTQAIGTSDEPQHRSPTTQEHHQCSFVGKEGNHKCCAKRAVKNKSAHWPVALRYPGSAFPGRPY